MLRHFLLVSGLWVFEYMHADAHACTASNSSAYYLPTVHLKRSAIGSNVWPEYAYHMRVSDNDEIKDPLHPQAA